MLQNFCLKVIHLHMLSPDDCKKTTKNVQIYIMGRLANLIIFKAAECFIKAINNSSKIIDKKMRKVFYSLYEWTDSAFTLLCKFDAYVRHYVRCICFHHKKKVVNVNSKNFQPGLFKFAVKIV